MEFYFRHIHVPKPLAVYKYIKLALAKGYFHGNYNIVVLPAFGAWEICIAATFVLVPFLY